jgi:serine/threonine protein kinase
MVFHVFKNNNGDNGNYATCAIPLRSGEKLFEVAHADIFSTMRLNHVKNDEYHNVEFAGISEVVVPLIDKVLQFLGRKRARCYPLLARTGGDATLLRLEERDNLLANSEKLKEIDSLQLDLDENDLTFKIGNYYLLGVLGEGSFGLVLKGHSVQMNDGVAVKVIEKCRLNTFPRLLEVNNEIAVLRHHGRSHENIIGFYEVIHGPQSIYIVMEKATMDLRELVSMHRYMFNKQCDLFQQLMAGILHGLAHLHERGISHNDIHPGNVMISTASLDWDTFHLHPKGFIDGHRIEASEVRLCDFGMASISEHHTGKPLPEAQASIVLRRGGLGRPFNRAPETATRETFEARKADVWSVGCIILELNYTMDKKWKKLWLDNSPKKMERGISKVLKRWRSAASDEEYKLLHNLAFHHLLVIDVDQRDSARDALRHPFFKIKH